MSTSSTINQGFMPVPGVDPNNGNGGSPTLVRNSVQLVTTQHAKVLTEKMLVEEGHKAILEVYESFKAMRYSDADIDFVKLIDSGIHELIKMDFGQKDWKQIDPDQFFLQMLAEYPADKNSSKSSLEERFYSLDSSLFIWDVNKPKCYNKLFQACVKILQVPDSLPVDDPRRTHLLGILTEKIGKKTIPNMKLYQHMKHEDFKPTSLEEWFERVRQLQNEIHSCVVKLESHGFQIVPKGSTQKQSEEIKTTSTFQNKSYKKTTPNGQDKAQSKDIAPKKRKNEEKACDVCGRNGHDDNECNFIKDPSNKHPDANTSGSSWKDSDKGKAWAAKGHQTLPYTQMLNGNRWEPPKSTNITSKIQKKKKCESVQDEMNTIQCELIIKSNTLPTFCLLDTGALGGNYISTEIGNLLEREDAFKCKSKRRRIEGAIKGTYEETTKECKVSIRFVNEVSKVNETIHFIAAIIHTNIPIIIGRKTIKREQLVNKLPSQFIEIINNDENTYQLKAGEKGEIDHLPSQLSRPEPAIKKGEFE